MTIALERPVGTTDPVTLVEPEMMERLAARIVKDHPEHTTTTARRIVAQTAAFLATGAQRPGLKLSPSKPVDVGWHTWILHTVDYAAFCERIAGRFIHHVPTPDGEDAKGAAAAERRRTRWEALLTEHGFTVASARVLPAPPGPRKIGTLLVRAHA